MDSNINKWAYPLYIYEFIKQSSDEANTLTITAIVQNLKQHAGGIKEEHIRKTVTRYIPKIVLYDENIHVVLKDGSENYRGN